MPALNKSVLLPYPSTLMFELVERVEDYPTFLPWCAATEVRRDEQGMLASITINFKGIRQSFTTRNRHTPPGLILMELVDGPFRRLDGRWSFHPLAPDACKVGFALDYEIAGGVLGRALGPVFGQITASFVDAFVRRAQEIYG